MISNRIPDILLLLPIYMRNEDVFWNDSDARDLFVTLLRGLKDLPFPLLVLGENSDLLNIARSMNIDVLAADVSGKTQSSFLPPGAASAACNAMMAGYDPSIFVVLNYRNPNIPALLLGALESYKRDRMSLLASVVRTRDNPCQLVTAFEVVAAGIFSNHAGEYVNQLLVGERCTSYQLIDTGLVLQAAMASESTSVLIVFRSDGHEGQREISRPGLPVVPPEEGQDLVWYILTPSEDGRLDLQLPFAPNTGDWCYGVSNQSVIRNDRQVTGRQQFPEAWVWDGSIAIWNNTRRQNDIALSDLKPKGFVLPSEQSIIINHRIDYLAWMIDRERQKHTEDTRKSK